jgi:PIN domain nuclease of toxin-antitoxin system
MRFLLDTHIWLWSLGEPDRISKRIHKLLDNPENQLWLSSISIWEALLLVRKGRLRIENTFEDWLADALTSIPLTEAPLTFEVARALAAVQLPHADPADMFLAATARAFDLTLLTADRNLIQTKGISVIQNS